MALLRVGCQFPAQGRGKKDLPVFPFQEDLDTSPPGSFNSNKPELADPDTGGANGLHQKTDSFIFLFRRCSQKEEYEVEKSVARADLTQFLDKLRDMEII